MAPATAEPGSSGPSLPVPPLQRWVRGRGGAWRRVARSFVSPSRLVSSRRLVASVVRVSTTERKCVPASAPAPTPARQTTCRVRSGQPGRVLTGLARRARVQIPKYTGFSYAPLQTDANERRHCASAPLITRTRAGPARPDTVRRTRTTRINYTRRLETKRKWPGGGRFRPKFRSAERLT